MLESGVELVALFVEEEGGICYAKIQPEMRAYHWRLLKSVMVFEAG